MALQPNATQIPAQRVSLTENAANPLFTSREWYRFFDTLHTHIPTLTVFTPVFAPVANVTAITPGTSFANQMGAVVALTGTFTLTPAGAGDTVFRLQPPVLDGLALAAAAGTFAIAAAGSGFGSVIAAANSLEFRLNAVTTAASLYAYNVNYQIA